MKKLGQKKLTLSLKGAKDKQQKISQFFMSSSKDADLNEDKKIEGRKMIEVKNQCTQQGSIGRLPGANLCIKCLKMSPNGSNGYCNQCNTAEDNFVIVDSPVAKSSKTGSLKQQSACTSNLHTTSSPDVIPGTPPVKIKQRINNTKSIKRKFIFEDETYQKKKCLLDNIKDCNPSDKKNLSSRNNACLSSEKENTEGKQGNLFCQLSCDSTNEYSGNSDQMNLHEIKFKSLNNCKTILEPSKTVASSLLHPSHCGYKANNKTCISEIDSNNRFLDDNVIKPNSSITNQTNSINARSGTSSGKEDVLENKTIQQDFTHSSILDCKNETSNGDPKLPTLESSSVLASSADKKDITVAVNCNNTEGPENDIFDDIDFFEDVLKEPLRLDNSTRCRVTSVEHINTLREVVLGLTSYDATDTGSATCVLRGSWANSSICVGDIVSVTAMPVSDQEGCWVVDNERGLVVEHPDTLVSGTTVVGSLFCMRRSVLSDMYRGLDSDSAIMVIGSFLHQLLQEVLKKKVSTIGEIRSILSEFTKTRYFVFNLYSSGMSVDKTMETLYEFIPKIHVFLQKYLLNERTCSSNNTWNDRDSWKGKITNIADIEENIWSPRLGLKGKVDVTVNTSAVNCWEKVMPLELKTGRASFSAEHRGQVILYTMMMSELGRAVDSGLLLYLREGVMKEVPVGPVERRDLMLLRNELVTQLKASHLVVVSSAHKIAAPTLPPPINHHSACAKCPYLTLCSAALRVNDCKELSEKNPLKQLSQSSTSHLQMEHIVYVFHWTGLLRLEHTEAVLKSPALHHIWTLPSEIRAKRGTCVTAAKLVEQVMEVVGGNYQHVFACNKVAGCLSEGDYVIVSSASRPAIAAGPITLVAQSQLTILLERDLSVHGSAEDVWQLDKYESQSGLTFNMTNLGCLLDDTNQAERLRKAVIDLELPQFSPKLSSRVLKASVDLLSGLNDQQRKAIFRALAANHYILIKGMPGTGKTATIVALVQLAVRLGQSVVVTSHTHSAVDNVLLRLRGKVDMLRLGSAHKLHPELMEYGETGQNFDSPEKLNEFYNSKSVVGVTCLGSSHPLLTKRQFDLCIVDEATQVLQPTVLRPLFSAHKFILIGDPNQLPPLVRSSKAKELGLGESLFSRLDRPAVTSELSLQYRMNQTITDVANILTYSGRLQCGNPEVASAVVTLAPTALEDEPAWLVAALGNSLKEAVVSVDTGVCEAVDCVNVREADIVLQLLAALIKGLPGERVGVIAPYRAQVEYLRQKVRPLFGLVEVNTVDQYQGRDKDVIIYSCTRSAKPTESDILGDKSRLTVAITRARHKLIIVGNVTLLRGYMLFDQLFNSLPPSCIIPVT